MMLVKGKGSTERAREDTASRDTVERTQQLTGQWEGKMEIPKMTDVLGVKK